jgi:transposase
MVPPAKPGGRKRTIDVREILNGIFYVLWTGCQWQALPKDLPPKSTVWAYFDLWTWDGTLQAPHSRRYARPVAERGGACCQTFRIVTGLGFLRSPFAQAYPGPTAVFIDELNTGGLQCAANCQIVSRCHRGVTLSEFSTSDRAQAYG